MCYIPNDFTQPQAQVIAALIAGIVSMIVAIWSFITGLHNQKKSAAIQSEVELLRGKIADENSESAARRAYEYEARKKLYHEYEPVKFRLLESCETAAYLIKEICTRFITDGNKTEGALPTGNYFNLAIMYHLLMPVVHFKISRKKLTNIDLQLNSKIHLQYLLNKQTYMSFYSDADIASIANIDYTPYVPNWKELREINPSKYRRQGFAVGRLDNAIDDLIDIKNLDQAIGFGEFESKIKEVSNSDYAGSLGALRDLFNDFSPSKRPILWRIIIIQYTLYNLILFSNEESNISIEMLKRKALHFLEENKSCFNLIEVESTTKDVTTTAISYFSQKVFPFLEIHFRTN